MCNGHSPEIATNYSHLYDIQTDRMRQFHYWYSELSTTDMKKLAHQPQDLILDCSFSMMKTTLCNHFKTLGGTRIFSTSKGVCYSLNLKEYFPEDLTESLKATRSMENVMQSGEMKETDIFYSGPIMGLQLILNLEGNIRKQKSYIPYIF